MSFSRAIKAGIVEIGKSILDSKELLVFPDPALSTRTRNMSSAISNFAPSRSWLFCKSFTAEARPLQNGK